MWQRYAAIGDSITAGYGDPVSGLPLRSWPSLLVERIKPLNPAFRYLNAGMPGADLDDILRDQVNLALELKPDLLSITAGANDIIRPHYDAERFMAQYHALLDRFAGAMFITLTYPVPPAAETQDMARLLQVNEFIRECSGRRGAVLLDLANHPAAQDPANLSWDGLHPNARGYRAIADYAWDQLRTNLQGPGPANDGA